MTARGKALVLNLAVATCGGMAVGGLAAGFGSLSRPEVRGGVETLLTAPVGTSGVVLDRSVRSLRARLEGERIDGFDVRRQSDRSIALFFPSSVRDPQGLVKRVASRDLVELREVIQTISVGNPGYSADRLTPLDAGTSDQAIYGYEDADHDGRFTPNADPKVRLGPAELDDSSIADASAAKEALPYRVAVPTWQVTFTLDEEGSRVFASVTGRLIGKELAVVLDGCVIVSPTVQSAITGGGVQISGIRTKEEAMNLAAAMRHGSLPVPLDASPIVRVKRVLPSNELNLGTWIGLAGLGGLAAFGLGANLRSRRPG